MTSKAQFLVNLLNREVHHIQHSRVGYELLPQGSRGCDRSADDLVRCGHLELLRMRLEKLRAEGGDRAIREECGW